MFVSDFRKEFYELVQSQVTFSPGPSLKPRVGKRECGREAMGGPGQEGGEEPGFGSLHSVHPLFSKQSVLLFVASDVDALCACKILQVSSADQRRAGEVRGEGTAGQEQEIKGKAGLGWEGAGRR